MRIALQDQRDDLLAFAAVLDSKLEAITQTHALPMSVVGQACVRKWATVSRVSLKPCLGRRTGL